MLKSPPYDSYCGLPGSWENHPGPANGNNEICSQSGDALVVLSDEGNASLSVPSTSLEVVSLQAVSAARSAATATVPKEDNDDDFSLPYHPRERPQVQPQAVGRMHPVGMQRIVSHGTRHQQLRRRRNAKNNKDEARIDARRAQLRTSCNALTTVLRLPFSCTDNKSKATPALQRWVNWLLCTCVKSCLAVSINFLTRHKVS
jgi:hypothetical protein